MKSIFILLAAIMNLNFTFLKAMNEIPRSTKKSQHTFLHISGILDRTDDPGSYIVELISSNRLIDTIFVTQGEEKFDFDLDKNIYYLIRISKKGYLKKTLAINTAIEMLESELYFFEFEIELIKETELKNLNKTMLNYPAASISYDYKSDSFSHNEDYSVLIKNELYCLPTGEQQNINKEITPTLSTKCHSFLLVSN